MNRPATYPSLDISEIVDSCRPWGCPITEEDVLKPTPGTVQSIFEWWMQRVLGLNSEDCRRAASDQLDHMECSDIYREMMYISVFQLAMNQLLQRAAIDDFTTKDLTAPTTTRFRGILSGVINFYLFEQEQSAEYLEPMQDEDEALIQEEDELIKINQRMREEIDATREERRLNEPKTAEEKVETEKLWAEIKQMRVTSQALMAQFESEKEAINKIVSETTEITSSNDRQMTEITRIQLQVIRSPERVRSTLQDMSANLSREQEAVKSLEMKERQMIAKMGILAKYDSDLGQCVKILSDWQVDVDKATKASDLFQTLHDEYEALKIEMADTEAKIALLERRIVNIREEIDRFVQKTEQKLAKAEEKEIRLKEQYESLMEQKTRLDNQALRRNQDAILVETQIKAIHEDFQKELDRGESAFRKIKDQVMLYSIKINKALDSINSTNVLPIDL